MTCPQSGMGHQRSSLWHCSISKTWNNITQQVCYTRTFITINVWKVTHRNWRHFKAVWKLIGRAGQPKQWYRFVPLTSTKLFVIKCWYFNLTLGSNSKDLKYKKQTSYYCSNDPNEATVHRSTYMTDRLLVYHRRAYMTVWSSTSISQACAAQAMVWPIPSSMILVVKYSVQHTEQNLWPHSRPVINWNHRAELVTTLQACHQLKPSSRTCDHTQGLSSTETIEQNL